MININSQETFIRRNTAWISWLIASLFYSYQFILRVMPNIMMNDIVKQFDISTATFGQFSGIYYIGYSLMHLPLGILLDRVGPKKIMPICILMTGAGLLPIIISDFWIYPIIGRVLIGMGSSAAILGTFKIIRMMYQEEKFTQMLSFSVTIGLVGAIYGGGPLNYFCATFGYKTVIAVLIGFSIVLSLITYLCAPTIKAERQTAVLADIKTVFFTPKAMIICVLAGLMVGPLEGFADVWAGEFFKTVYGFETGIAASLPSMIYIGMCIGSPILSYIASKSGNYMATIMGSGVLMAIAFALLLTAKIPVFVIGSLFVIVGVCCAYQILAIYLASKYVPEHVVGLTTAVANMIIMVFGYFFHSIIGVVIDSMGGLKSPEAFIFGIAIIPIALMIAVIGLYITFYNERLAKEALIY